MDLQPNAPGLDHERVAKNMVQMAMGVDEPHRAQFFIFDKFPQRIAFLQGVTAGAGHMVVAGTTLGTAYGGIRVRVGSTNYWVPLYAAEPT